MTRWRGWLPRLALALLLLPGRAALAQSAPIDTLSRALLEVINTGDSAAQASFLAAHLSPDALAAAPLAERVAYLQAMRRTSGGLELGGVSGNGNPVELRVRSKRGGRWAQIYVFPDRRDPTRIGDFGGVARRSPAADSADVWPTARVASETLVAREIARHAGAAAARDEFSGTVLVAKGDRIVFARAYGLAERGRRLPNRLDTRFALASMGKMFTAAAIAQLVEAGKLRFGDTLARVLPEYPNADAARRITIAHLLSHSAGLGMLFDRPGYDPHRRYRRHADLLPIFAATPLDFEPGTRSAYSNEGFVVLGAVIERVTGQSYRDYVREHVLLPAGMRSTDVYAIDEDVPNRAVGYAFPDDDPLGVGERRPNWGFLHAGGGEAAGGQYATAPDLLRFVQALRSGRLLRRELVDTLLAPHSAGHPWYGYGFFTGSAGGKPTRGHGGGGPGSGMSTECTWLVDGSYTVVVLSNYDPQAASTLADGILGFLAAQ